MLSVPADSCGPSPPATGRPTPPPSTGQPSPPPPNTPPVPGSSLPGKEKHIPELQAKPEILPVMIQIKFLVQVETHKNNEN